MASSLPIQVEVSVQDCFFDATAVEASASTAQTAESPISEQTWETWFRTWLEYLNPQLSPNQQYELSLRLTNNAEIQALNALYRHKDQPTDVLAFAALEVEYPQIEELQANESLYLGDIVISVEIALLQAQQQGHSLKQELAWLASHALLHLLGWDHPDEPSLIIMLQQQETLLQTLGLTAGYYQVGKATAVYDINTEANRL
jgi:probable rRNA maturation factor